MAGAGGGYPHMTVASEVGAFPLADYRFLTPAFDRDAADIGDEGYDHVGFLSSMVPVTREVLFWERVSPSK